MLHNDMNLNFSARGAWSAAKIDRTTVLLGCFYFCLKSCKLLIHISGTTIEIRGAEGKGERRISCPRGTHPKVGYHSRPKKPTPKAVPREARFITQFFGMFPFPI